MNNAERLRYATELLAARGEGMRDGLRWVLRRIMEETEDDVVYGPIINSADLVTLVRAKLENKNGQGQTQTQTTDSTPKEN